jgi:hypothetical protein
MPDFQQPPKDAAFSVAVHFPTEEDADRFFALIERPRVRWLWWPRTDGHRGMNRAEEEVWDGT